MGLYVCKKILFCLCEFPVIVVEHVYIKKEVRTVQFTDILLMRPLLSEYSTIRPCLSKNVNI